jgi:hypothetical protein
MITRHNRFLGTLLLLVGMLVAPPLLALDITGVDPESAPQGTVGQQVRVYGSGFEKNAEVTFLLDGSPAPEIAVQSTRTLSSGEILTTIDISADALADVDYTLQVSQTKRRGGKGTTLYATAKFRVTGKTKETVSCAEVFGLGENQCSCAFSRSSEGGTGTPGAVRWGLQGDCTTYATLQLPQYEVLNGNGYTLTAASPFTGLSVLANTGHRTHVFDLNFQVATNASATGCGDGQLKSAISFVLDGSKVHPEDLEFSVDSEGRTYTLTRLRAWGIFVRGTALCRAIEFRRDGSYDAMLQAWYDDADPAKDHIQPPSAYVDAVTLIGDVQITTGSYTEAGIAVGGFINAGVGGRSDDKIGIQDSTVMGAAGAGGSAIRFGPVFGPGTVKQNTIAADGGVGIAVEGGDGMDDVIIENNNVTGADTGVQVDGLVDSAFFKSNILVGNGSGDGIDTHALDNRYRSNRIDGFDCKVKEAGSCIEQ